MDNNDPEVEDQDDEAYEEEETVSLPPAGENPPMRSETMTDEQVDAFVGKILSSGGQSLEGKQPNVIHINPPSREPQSFVPDEPSSFVPDAPDTAKMQTFVQGNLDKFKAEKAEKAKREPIDVSVPTLPADDWAEALVAGWQMGNVGMFNNKGRQDFALGSDPSKIAVVASMASQVAGDLPAMIAGGLLGGLAGTPLGPVGRVVGTEFGANAMPAALRGIMMEYYDEGTITTPGEFFDAFSAITLDTLKAGGIGVATMGAGRFAGKMAGKAGGGVATQAVSKTVSEIATMTTATAAMEGELPTFDDFINGAIVVGGLGLAVKGASKLRRNFVETGELPHEFVEKAAQDVTIKQELAAVDELLGPKPNPDKPIEVAPMEFKQPDWMQVRPKEVGGKIAEFYEKSSNTYRRAVDDLASLDMIREKLGAGEKIAPGADPYALGRNWRGADTRAWSFENYRTLDFKTGKENGEGLAQIYKELPKELHTAVLSESESAIISRVNPDDVKGKPAQWSKLNAYRISKRALELSEREVRGKEEIGVETGIDLAHARRVVDENSATLEPYVKRIEAWQDRGLQYLSDSGGISKKELGFIRKLNKDYVPFHRLLEDDPFSVKGPKGSSLKRIKGSGEMLLDPERVMRDNVKAMFKMAEKNRIMNRMVEMQENAPEGSEILMRKKPTLQMPIDATDDFVRFLKSHGFDEADIPDGDFTIFRPHKGRLLDNEIELRREKTGKKEVWQIVPEYADAMKALNYNPKQMNMFGKLVAVPARMLRTGTALSPDFIARNIFRDQVTATIQSKYKHVPFYDVIQSMGHMFKGTSEWNAFLESGGFSGGLDNIMPYLKEGDLHKLNQETKFMDRVWNNVNTPRKALGAAAYITSLQPLWRGLEKTSTYMENVPRFTEFRKSGGAEGGIDNMTRGAMAAREVTVDFQRAGENLRWASQFVPFMNAGVQGTDRAFRAFKERPKETIALAVATITVPSFFTWLNGKDDVRYTEELDWVKDLFWVVPTDWWQQAASKEDFMFRHEQQRRLGPNGEMMVNNGIVLRIPKPFEMGVIFGSMAERMLTKFFSNNPKDADKAFEGFGNTVVQAAIPNMLPPALVAPVEQIANHSFFLDSELVSQHSQEFLAPERYTKHTSETAKQIGKIIGHIPFIRDIGSRYTPLQAPAVIDNYLNSWGGTGGKYLVQLSDKLLIESGVAKRDEKPAWTWAEVPFARAFMIRYPDAKSEPIKEFYERYELAEQIENSLKLNKDSNPERYEEILAEHGGQLGKITDTRKILSQANKVLNNLYLSSTDLNNVKRTAEERTQLMTTVYFQMNDLARAANTELDSLQKQIKAKLEEGK